MEEERESKILKVLKNLGKPISTESISLFSGIHKQDTHEQLEKLARWKKVKKVGSYKIDYWKTIED